jgi:hypothetical protein
MTPTLIGRVEADSPIPFAPLEAGSQQPAGAAR